MHALANSFADYFIDKIDCIHATLIEKNSAQGNDASDVTLGNHVECNSVFSDFINVSYEDIKGLHFDLLINPVYLILYLQW